MRVIIVPVGKEPEVTDIEPGLKGLQTIVGGSIEMAGFDRDEPLSIICNEEGKIFKLPPNRFIPELQDIIHGDFAIVRCNMQTGENEDLTDEDIKLIRAKLTFDA